MSKRSRVPVRPSCAAVRVGALLLLAASLGGCGDRARPLLRLGHTTSLRDSGLMARLLPAFEASSGVEVVTIVQGTGAILRMAREQELDVVIVHAPEAERAFVADGHATERVPLLAGEFLLVGPTHDPARVQDLNDVRAALGKIAAAKAPFLSRGDGSGTHQLERTLWDLIQVRPAWPQYLESGRGMGATLGMADELASYTLVDQATWLQQRGRLSLSAHVRDPEHLPNPYSLLMLPEARTGAAHAHATQLRDFLTAPQARALIASFEIDGVKPYVIEPSTTSEAAGAR